MIPFRYAILAGGVLAAAAMALATGTASAQPADSGSTSSEADTSTEESVLAAETGTGQEPSDGQTPNIILTDILNDLIQINQGATALSQQEADRLAESNARLDAEASRRSGIPVMTADDQPPPSAGSGQEPSDNGPASLNSKLRSSDETADAREGLEADAAKP